MNPGLNSKVLPLLCVLFLVACGSDDGVEVDCPDGGEGEDWFWTGKVCRFSTKGFNYEVHDIAPARDSSDDLYAVGEFTAYKKNSVKYAARLNNSGDRVAHRLCQFIGNRSLGGHERFSQRDTA